MIELILGFLLVEAAPTYFVRHSKQERAAYNRANKKMLHKLRNKARADKWQRADDLSCPDSVVQPGEFIDDDAFIDNIIGVYQNSDRQNPLIREQYILQHLIAGQRRQS